MKIVNRSFIPYLVVPLLLSQLVNQMTPNYSYSQINDSLKVINNMPINENNIKLNLATEIPNELSYGSIIYLNKNLTNSYTLRKSSDSLNYLYSQAKVSEEAEKLTQHLPKSFQYKVINEEALKSYLQARSSLLISEPYFSSIIQVGKDFNINPILLFAITGQEQGFVPQNQDSATQIANNPYNVFCSWQDYNTNIIDSTQIACRTIINLSKDKPESVDTLVWINRKYSADQNWSNGVRTLYNDINTFISLYSR